MSRLVAGPLVHSFFFPRSRNCKATRTHSTAAAFCGVPKRGPPPPVALVDPVPIPQVGTASSPAVPKHFVRGARAATLWNAAKNRKVCDVSRVSAVKMSTFGAMKQPAFSENFFFRQLFDRESCTYTYLLADTDTREAVLIDPVIELADRDKKTLDELGLKLKYCINTHVHADHITGTGRLKRLLPDCKSGISEVSGADADVKFRPGDKVRFGAHELEVRPTPGHTNGCVTYVCHAQGAAFTGDALLIRGCGRTDFQEGSANTLYDSVWKQIFSLPENFSLYPAHDYKGQTSTSVAEEKKFNPRLSKPREEFIKIMDNLGLPYPKKIDVALPANKVCGLHDLPADLKHLVE